MYTTIKISTELKQLLEKMKMFDNESYENVIEDLIEDRLAQNPNFLKDIEEAREQIKKGEKYSFEEIEEKMKSKKLR